MSGRVAAGDQRRTLVLVVAALVLAVVAAVAAPSTFGRFTEQVVNPTNTAATGIFPTCQSTTNVGTPSFIYPMNDASGTVVADTSTPARTGTYRRAQIAYQQTGPCGLDAGTGVSLNLPVTGSTGTTSSFLSGPATTAAGPTVFSVSIWFRTNTVRGGRLIGFGTGTGTTESTTNYDRHLYLTNAGKVIFGVTTGTTKRITTSGTGFNDNQWHHAVGTVSSTGMRLYVDGVLAATNSAGNTAGAYSGQWRIGWDNLAGWSEVPTSEYYQGSLAWASVHATALSAAQVQEIYAAGQ